MTMTHDELKARIAEACARRDALPPVDRAIHDMEQRLSGAYGMSDMGGNVTKAQIRALMPEFVLADEIERLRAENERLRKTLRFYATASEADWQNDNGFNANAALA